MVRTVTIKLPEHLLAKIDELTIKLGIHSRSEFIREAVVAYIKELQQEQPPALSGYVIKGKIRKVVLK